MNKTLEQNLSQLMEFLQKGMTTAYDFSKQEVPLFIKEYLAWYFYEHLYYTLIGLIPGIIFGFITIYSIVKFEKTKDEEPWIPMFLICGLLSFIFMVVFLCNIKDCIKVTVAPRVVLMEQAKYLIK